MKHMKRILALALAVMMVMGLAISVSAEDTTTTYSITINNTASGHTYEAYQIFKGDLKEPTAVDPTDAATSNVLSNIVWGSGVTADVIPSSLPPDWALPSRPSKRNLMT